MHTDTLTHVHTHTDAHTHTHTQTHTHTFDNINQIIIIIITMRERESVCVCVCCMQCWLLTCMKTQLKKFKIPQTFQLSKFIWQRTGHFKFGKKMTNGLVWQENKITWQTVKETETKQIIKYMYICTTKLRRFIHSVQQQYNRNPI